MENNRFLGKGIYEKGEFEYEKQKKENELSDFECKIMLLQAIQGTKEYKIAMKSLFLRNKKRIKNIIEFYKTYGK